MPEIKNVSKLLFMISPIPVLQKHSEFERMRGCYCSFIIKKGLSSYGWLLLELRIGFEKNYDCKCLFQRNTIP